MPYTTDYGHVSFPDIQLQYKDQIQFSIASISNDSSDSTYIQFPAFLDSFNDAYTSDWNSVNYSGRGDTFYTYKGFQRKIGLGFTVYAASYAELKPMYQKLNYLASILAPDYSTGGFMRGNLIRLTIGGYLYEQHGFITGLTYDISNDTSWELDPLPAYYGFPRRPV